MAKGEGIGAIGAKRPRGRKDPRRRARREIAFWAVLASLVISALLTLDLLPAASLRLAGQLPVAGEISTRDFKAPADVEVVDEEATEKLRRDAENNALAVYDFDERQQTALGERLALAFEAARSIVPAEEESADGEAPAQSPLAAFRGEFGEVEMPAVSVTYLEATAFNPESQRFLMRLLEPVIRQMIVADPEPFERHIENAVTVRELASERERILTTADEVLTSESARGLIQSAAQRVVGVPEPARDALVPLAQALIQPNLDFNLRATDERRQAAETDVKAVVVRLRRGEIIARDGEKLTERHVMLLRGIAAQQRSFSQAAGFAGVASLLFLAMSAVWRFGTHSLPRFPRETRDARFLLFALVSTCVGTAFAVFLADAVAQSPAIAPIVEQMPEVLYYGIPIAASTMLVRMIHNAETAALFAVLAAMLAGLQIQSNVPYVFFALVGSLTAAVGAARVTQRGTLLRAGVRVGMVNIFTVLAGSLLQGHIAWAGLVLGAALGFLAGALSGVLVTGLAPMIESLFGYTTDVKLLELVNREQKLLRDLELIAPGTYHHSMMVGHLAEKAAEVIGANALLAKVNGYYHDIGKMRRPQFFVENFTVHGGENRHEKLAPSMSARIIQAHVKDGLEMGEANKLAEPIMQGIGQHHGTSIIRFFFEKAKESADPEKGELVHEHDYRYPGPKPQTREAGILMLADSVEAASRTLVDNTPSRVQQLVSRIINNYFRDGQLDECSLTLRDLNAIAKSFIDTLTAIRHERIDYPDPTDPEGRKLGEAIDEGVSERQQSRKKDRPDAPSQPRDDDLKRLGLD